MVTVNIFIVYGNKKKKKNPDVFFRVFGTF